MVFNVQLGTSLEDEHSLEHEFLSLPNKISQINHYSLGRNSHPMRPEFWMCTHVWETEFTTLDDMVSYENSEAYQNICRNHLDVSKVGSVVDVIAVVSYRVDDNTSAGNLLQPGRIRRIHIANIYEGASKCQRQASDDALLGMPAAIPEIKAWAMGYNLAKPRSGFLIFDHSWDSAFDDIESLQRYVTCDFHLGEVHEYARRGSQNFVLMDLQSCYYTVDSQMSG